MCIQLSGIRSTRTDRCRCVWMAGETSPYSSIIGVTTYIVVMCCFFMYWFDKQSWVPEMM